MAKTKYYNFRGKGHWAKVFEGNRDLEGPDGVWKASDGMYLINLEVEDDVFDEIADSGSQAADFAKENDDGVKVVRFKRPHVKFDREGNVLEWAGGAPKVFHKDGTPWDEGTDGYIGNGSEVEVRVAVYKAGRVGTRLEAVRVLDLVEYENKGYSGFDFDGE